MPFFLHECVSCIVYFSVSKVNIVNCEKSWIFNTLRWRLNGCRFADDTFKRIFLNEYRRILIKISLKLVPKGPINKNPPLAQIMVSLLTHICVTRPQWVISSYMSASLFIVAYVDMYGLVQGCSISIANAPEIQQSCHRLLSRKIPCHNGAWKKNGWHFVDYTSKCFLFGEYSIFVYRF